MPRSTGRVTAAHDADEEDHNWRRRP